MTLRRILILDQGYPSETNLYADVFVHVRALEYAKHAEVVVASTPNDAANWVYQGIRVRAFPDAQRLGEFIATFRPDVIAAHFVEGPIITDVLLRTDVPFVVWAHGFEAMGWYRMLYERQRVRPLASTIITRSKRLLTFRRLISHARRTGRGTFVVPSQWLLQAVQTDTLTRLPRAHVVPNPIDVDLFRYVVKPPELRTRVLLLRSFNSRKYATDIASEAIVGLSKHPAFDSFQFHIYGRGKYFAQDTATLRAFRNVEMHEHYLPQREIAAVHAEHGVMLCPTRQDTHGVTMCEAMSSGLVPITTRNSAIPEFVTDRVGGLLTSSSQEITDRLLELHADPVLFSRLSEGAAAEVRLKCGLPRVIERELEILERACRDSHR